MGEEGAVENSASDILLNSRLYEPHKVFWVGPTRGKASFIAQQNRALNLVWALHFKQYLNDNPRVAVIGAGLGGMTVTTALAAHNCEVHLFDVVDKCMRRQRNTRHRMIHPGINDWLLESDEEPYLTTDLPFLEWSAGECKKIAQELSDEFKKIKKNNSTKIIQKKHQIISYQKVMDDKYVLVLPDGKVSEGETAVKYDFIVIASGIHNERDVDKFKTKTYWEDDNLEASCDNEEYEGYYISGAGDGGLLDVLRLCFDLRDGELTYEIAKLISNSENTKTQELMKKILLCEQQRDDSEIINSYRKIGLDFNKDPDQYDDDLVKALTLENTDQLTPIYLMDKKHNNPFLSPAAPIHKLMVAIAMAQSKVFYKEGWYLLDANDNTFTIGIKSDQNGDDESAIIYDRHKNCLIVRHGAQVNLNLLPPEAERIDTIMSRTRSYESYNKKIWNDPFPVPNGIPCKKGDRIEFLDYKIDKVRDIVYKLDRNAQVYSEEEKYIIVSGELCERQRRLFGVDLIVREPQGYET